ncbi:MAG: hypothetical protein Q4E39_03990 [bacterium]|nr:hypothetical protein [bacterium]
MRNQLHRRRLGHGASISICFYYSIVYCRFTTKELKEKYLSSSDWYFSHQLNN